MNWSNGYLGDTRLHLPFSKLCGRYADLHLLFCVILTAQAGVQYVFVNLGTDHPAIIEALVKGQRERRDQWPKAITCPNEVCRQDAGSIGCSSNTR